MLHRQQVVARRHTRAALVHDFPRARVAQQRNKFVFQDKGRLETATLVEIEFEESIEGAGDVPCYRIKSLVPARKPVGRSRIDQPHPWTVEMDQDEGGVDRHYAGPALEFLCLGLRHGCRHRMALGNPLEQAAVEHCDGLVSQPAQ